MFAVPPGKKQFKCVLSFGGFKYLVTARLALSMLMIMMDRNECSITRFHSEDLTECIKSEQPHEYILGTYRSIDDRYHFAITGDSSSDGTAMYYSYYFKKSRNGYDEVRRDYDNPDMMRVLASLTTAAKVCPGELEVEDDFEFLHEDLIDYFD